MKTLTYKENIEKLKTNIPEKPHSIVTESYSLSDRINYWRNEPIHFTIKQTKFDNFKMYITLFNNIDIDTYNDIFSICGDCGYYPTKFVAIAKESVDV